MEKYMDLIENNSLLNRLSSSEIDICFKDGSFHINTWGKNNIIHFSGEVCSNLEIILSGHVSVERIDEKGNLMTIGEFYSGEILGGNLLFSKAPYYPMTVTAKQPTVILKINKERLLSLFSLNSDFLKNYLEFVADHTTILGDRIRHYVGRTIRECVTSYLEQEISRQGSSKIALPITKKAWAERIGVSRTSLSRELAKMQKDGLIRYEGQIIEVL